VDVAGSRISRIDGYGNPRAKDLIPKNKVIFKEVLDKITKGLSPEKVSKNIVMIKEGKKYDL